MRRLQLAVIPGDGIGPEIISQGTKILQALESKYKIDLQLTQLPYSADYYLKNGISIPDDFIRELDRNYQALIMGPLGDPRVPHHKHAYEILNKLRSALNLSLAVQRYMLFNFALMPLKEIPEEKVDFLLFKELSAGFRSQIGGILNSGTTPDLALQTGIYNAATVKQFIHNVARLCTSLKRHKITLITNRTLFPHLHQLWYRVFTDLQTEYKNFQWEVSSAEKMTLQILRDPSQLDVVMSPNIFGDIFTYLAFFIQGGPGFAYTCELHPDKFALFRILQNAAVKYKGHNIANPLGVAQAIYHLLKYLNLPEAAGGLYQALTHVLKKRQLPLDMGGILGTAEMGDYLVTAINKQ